MEIASFFQLGSRPLDAPVVYLHATRSLGVVPLMYTVQVSL
jgi:hypothetical protein